MSLSIQIFLPIVPAYCKFLYFSGYFKVTKTNEITIYITKFSESKQIIERTSGQDIIFGYWDNYLFSKSSLAKHFSRKFNHFLVLHHINKPQIEKLLINGRFVKTKERCIIVLYEYDRIRESEVEWEYSDNLSKLQNLLRNENHGSFEKIPEGTLINCPYWLTSSMFIQHFISYLNILKWLFNTIKQDKSVRIFTVYL